MQYRSKDLFWIRK